eukprot:jgi/Botrbrau1/14981/Bobra.0018s0081.1
MLSSDGALSVIHSAAPLAERLPGGIDGLPKPGVPASLPSAEALSRLQALVRDLQQRSDGGVDYLTALVRVFAEQLNAPENANLHPFFVAVPALTLNAVEGALLAKEQLQRRGRGPPEPGFTHDGFALGIAFLLQVINSSYTLRLKEAYRLLRGIWWQGMTLP